MRLMAVSGRIEIKVTEKYLIDRGILANRIFNITIRPTCQMRSV
jgi:hypothetical protein